MEEWLEKVVEAIPMSRHSVIMMGQLFYSGFLGALVGLERDIHGRSAGLRTHLLVSMGATLFMLVSLSVGGADPSRIAAQIVSGIGFLGAGAIMKEGLTVRGLTTASCLWVVAGVGMAVGVHQHVLAAIATVISLVSLSMLNNFDKFYKRESYRVLTICVPIDCDSNDVLDVIRCKNTTILFVDFDHDRVKNSFTLRISLRLLHKGTTDKVFSLLRKKLDSSDLNISKITWTHGRDF